MELADEPLHGAWRVLAQLKEPAHAALPADVNSSAITAEQSDVGGVVSGDFC